MSRNSFIVSRRGLFGGAALGAAALAAPQLLVRSATAQEATPEVPAAAVRRLGLGAFTVTTVTDGLTVGDGPHPTFGEDQPPEAVAELLEENFLPADRGANSFTPALVGAGEELVLFDTGLGAGARAGGLGQLRERLALAGRAPEDVTVVVITHFHGDHIGGLMEDGAPAFPNARYVAGAAEYDFWTEGEVPDNVAASVVPLAENMTFVEDGDEVVPGITAVGAFGHTPGHLAFHLESEGERLMITADTANHFVASLQRPDWHVAFDMDKEQAAATRRELFGLIAADRIPFIGYHMPPPAIGYVQVYGDGFRYVPATYQFEV